MYLGYNTNGMAHHRLTDAIRILNELGYRGIAITIDHGALPSYAVDSKKQTEEVCRLLVERGMRSVIETGARFLLNPKLKHQPTLLSESDADRMERIKFYEYAIDCAVELGSDCVSIWSGMIQQVTTHQRAMERLVDGLIRVVTYAADRGVEIGFEPEPGMMIDSMSKFEELTNRIDLPNFRLTLDVGHLHCQGEVPIDKYISQWATMLVNVHIEDMRAGDHKHLMFGEGEIDFHSVWRALRKSGYSGGVYVELSRHSHDALAATGEAFEFLSKIDSMTG